MRVLKLANHVKWVAEGQTVYARNEVAIFECVVAVAAGHMAQVVCGGQRVWIAIDYLVTEKEAATWARGLL